jgi:hypothetical protein
LGRADLAIREIHASICKAVQMRSTYVGIAGRAEALVMMIVAQDEYDVRALIASCQQGGRRGGHEVSACGGNHPSNDMPRGYSLR